MKKICTFFQESKMSTSEKLHKTKKTSVRSAKKPNAKAQMNAKKNPWLNFLKEWRANHTEKNIVLMANASEAYKKLGEREKAAYGVENFVPAIAGASKAAKGGSGKEK